MQLVTFWCLFYSCASLNNHHYLYLILFFQLRGARIMTRFIDTHTMSTLVERVGIEQLLSELCQFIEHDFKRWDQFDKSARLACHSDIGVIELMPTADKQLYGFKYVNGHPANTHKGLSTVMAFGALAEVATGYPLLLSELTISTAFRTAATSAMVARKLARPESKSMAIIGCGAQSEFQTIAFHALLGVTEVRAYDIDPLAIRKFAANLALFPNLKVITALSTAEAVKGADIVSTVTADKACATILTPEMIEPGMHINAIGGDCPGKTELHSEVLRRGKIFVEYEPQTRIEGDIQQLDGDHPVTEFWQLLTGSASGRESAEQITIFDSVGFAMEDFSMLRYLHKTALELDLGEDISLVPTMDDPKNLFSKLANGQAVTSIRRVA
jgi:ornithine cyclodeaminase